MNQEVKAALRQELAWALNVGDIFQRADEIHVDLTAAGMKPQRVVTIKKLVKKADKSPCAVKVFTDIGVRYSLRHDELVHVHVG